MSRFLSPVPAAAAGGTLAEMNLYWESPDLVLSDSLSTEVRRLPLRFGCSRTQGALY
jgi:hypothetical protein